MHTIIHTYYTSAQYCILHCSIVVYALPYSTICTTTQLGYTRAYAARALYCSTVLHQYMATVPGVYMVATTVVLHTSA